MSCRSTPLTSAATTFARLNSDLSDVQTLSAFHALRAEVGRTADEPSPQEWRDYLATERAFISSHPNLTDARRASLLRRMDQAAKQPMPDGQTWQALRRLRPHTQAQSRELRNRYQSLADRLGVPVDQVRRRAEELAAEVDTSRSASPPEGYTDVTLRAFRDQRLPVDRQTVHALTRLEQEARTAEARRQPQTSENLRCQRHPVESAAIAEIGYDPDGGRLEVVFHSNTDRVYAYRNVPASVYEQMRNESAGRAWHQHIRNNDSVRYANQEEADRDAFRRQCPSCGQFTGSGHTCPSRVTDARSELGALAASLSADPDDDDLGDWASLFEDGNDAVVLDTAGDLSALAAAASQASAAVEAATDEEAERQRAFAELSGLSGNVEPRSIAYQPRTSLADPVSGVRTMLPTNRVLEQETLTGPVQIDLMHFGDRREDHDGDDSYALSGSVVVERDSDGTLTANMRQARCSCYAYRRHGHCPHIEAQRIALQRRLTPEKVAVEDVQRAQAAVEDALRQDWMRSQHFATEARKQWVAGAEANYSQDFGAFEADVAAARARRDAGEPVVPFTTDNASDGMLTRESGRGFGVEIEFDFPEGMEYDEQQEALRRIGEELYAAGITSTDYQRDYHAVEEDGYTDEQEHGWSFEEDGTVAGEIVSPIMYDEPKSWENLAKVCEIVKKHGGMASARSGSHVHVGTADYGRDAGTYTELARLVNQHEDVIYRLAQNPNDRFGEHRPLGYCSPNSEVPLAGYRDMYQAVSDHGIHERGLNMANMNGNQGDHAEFRHWDATLDPGVIQAQVKMSAAMTVAARRIASEHGSTARPRERLGSHHTRIRGLLAGSRRKLTEQERMEDTATARSFIDTLYRRHEDKAQVAALFAVTKWQRRNPYRGGHVIARDESAA